MYYWSEKIALSVLVRYLNFNSIYDYEWRETDDESIVIRCRNHRDRTVVALYRAENLKDAIMYIVNQLAD